MSHFALQMERPVAVFRFIEKKGDRGRSCRVKLSCNDANFGWYSFIYAGKRIQEPAKTSRKTVAVEAERLRRLELEKTLAGMPIEKRANRINSVADMVKAYETRYALDHRNREQSILFFQGTLGEAAPRNPAFCPM